MSLYRSCSDERAGARTVDGQTGWFVTGTDAGRAPVGYVPRHDVPRDGYPVGALLTDIMLMLAERGLRPALWGEDMGPACAALAQTLCLLGIDPVDRDGVSIDELGALAGPPVPEID